MATFSLFILRFLVFLQFYNINGQSTCSWVDYNGVVMPTDVCTQKISGDLGTQSLFLQCINNIVYVSSYDSSNCAGEPQSVTNSSVYTGIDSYNCDGSPDDCYIIRLSASCTVESTSYNVEIDAIGDVCSSNGIKYTCGQVLNYNKSDCSGNPIATTTASPDSNSCDIGYECGADIIDPGLTTTQSPDTDDDDEGCTYIENTFFFTSPTDTCMKSCSSAYCSSYQYECESDYSIVYKIYDSEDCTGDAITETDVSDSGASYNCIGTPDDCDSFTWTSECDDDSSYDQTYLLDTCTAGYMFTCDDDEVTMIQYTNDDCTGDTTQTVLGEDTASSSSCEISISCNYASGTNSDSESAISASTTIVIIAVVGGVLVLIVIIAVIIFFVCCRNMKMAQQSGGKSVVAAPVVTSNQIQNEIKYNTISSQKVQTVPMVIATPAAPGVAGGDGLPSYDNVMNDTQTTKGAVYAAPQSVNIVPSAPNMDINMNEQQLPYGWIKVYTADGRPYYQNDITKQTQWEKPIMVNHENKHGLGGTGDGVGGEGGGGGEYGGNGDKYGDIQNFFDNIIGNKILDDDKNKYFAVFVSNGFDTMQIIKTLTNQDLIDSGIQKLGHRKIILSNSNQITNM